MEPPNVHGLPRRVALIGMPPCSTPVAADEDDSFFELELAVPDSDTSKCSISTSTTDSASAVIRVASASPGDKLLSKRKILPFEGLNRPHSPISLLKSAPRFRVFAFTQSKSTAAVENAGAGQKQGKHGGNGLAALRRSGSSRNADSPEDIGGSRRFSREVIRKYLRLLKPLYVRVSKKHGGGSGSEMVSQVAPSASASPPKATVNGKGKPPTGLPKSKQLGKSRSASAATTRAESPARMDDSLAQLQDGIQSAILHCKRSLSASRDFSPLSRSDAGSAHDGKTTG
ncbi:hypothetical protein MLD38_033519 [Melastoma candidum]|uniref:Uncharacterized protein n=1 Tax=Melastoma candidum TaxID=119954 RepID=A0ACB9M757_9MYRT|nr:hypothetical protein MLD38_033519 [Melastoma candidum]